MIINNTKPSLESSSSFKESFFSVQDTGMIFDILRNKLYSNPIAAICREISCNARDTHRAVGKFDVPIQIQLPNALEPFFKVKDNGEGISPDRMENIFIKYTASTKREDNIQTGGWGIGCKCPFSYSDAFVVVTVFNGVKYSYSAVIDETKVGKMALMSEEPTSEPNGTEIIIPVKKNDFKNFADATEFATRHWDIKPIIVGNTINYLNSAPILKGNNWQIIRNNDWNKEVKIIVDGIEYPCDLNELRKYCDNAKLIEYMYGNILLYFPVGSLSLSANRESIYLDDATKSAIAKAFNTVKLELKANIISKIDECDNLWDANVYYTEELRKTFKDVDFLGNISWQGYPIKYSYTSVNCLVSSFEKGKYSRRLGNQPDKVTRSISRELHFRKNTLLLINDLGIQDVNVKIVKSLFNDSTSYIEVISPGDKDINNLIKEYNLDKMNLKYLSSLVNVKNKKYTQSSLARMTVFLFSPNCLKFNQISYKEACDFDCVKVICKVSKHDRKIILKNRKILDSSILSNINSPKPVLFFGVDCSVDDSRIKKDFEGFIYIEDYLEEICFKNKTVDDFIKIKYAVSISNQSFNLKSALFYNNLFKFGKDLSEESFFKNKGSKINDICNLASSRNDLYVYENLKDPILNVDVEAWIKKNPDLDVDYMCEMLDKKYPMLKCVDKFQLEKSQKQIIDYINLVDSTEVN